MDEKEFFFKSDIKYYYYDYTRIFKVNEKYTLGWIK